MGLDRPRDVDRLLLAQARIDRLGPHPPAHRRLHRLAAVAVLQRLHRLGDDPVAVGRGGLAQGDPHLHRPGIEAVDEGEGVIDAAPAHALAEPAVEMRQVGAGRNVREEVAADHPLGGAAGERALGLIVQVDDAAPVDLDHALAQAVEVGRREGVEIDRRSRGRVGQGHGMSNESMARRVAPSAAGPAP